MKKRNKSSSKILVLIIAFYAACFAHAQMATITGTVFANKEPIPFAAVYVKGGTQGTTTNIEGKYILKVPVGTLILVVQSQGFLTEKQVVNATEGKQLTLDVILKQDLQSLEEVVVIGERKKKEGTETISQTTIDKKDIASVATQSLGESLAQVDGVTYASVGTNTQLPIIHGLSGNRILVLNNGLKHSFQNWGNQHAPEININALNNITVIKGAGGVRFGPEALSGVILTEPNPLELDKPFYVNVGLGYQTNGRGGNANFELGKGTDQWSYFANGSYTRIGDRFAPGVNLTDAEREEFNIVGRGRTDNVVDLTNTGKGELAFSAGTRYNLDNWDIKVYYSFIKQDLGLLRSSFVNSPRLLIDAFNSPVPTTSESFSHDIREPNTENSHHFSKVEIDWNYNDQGKLTFRAGVQLNGNKEFTVRRNESRPIIDLDLLTFDYQLEWAHPKWNGFDGLIGVQYFTQNNDNNAGTFNVPFIPNYNANRFGFFAVEKIELGKNSLEAGIRFDAETNDVRGRQGAEGTQAIFRDRYSFTNITASLGYNWKLSNASSFKTNFGSAFRTPNVAELFSFGQQGFFSTFGLLRFTDNAGTFATQGVTALEDSDVELEKGYKLTNEFKTSNSNNAHALTTYINYIENFVFNRPIGVTETFAGARPVFLINQSDALFAGFDYTWKRDINNKFSTTYGLSYLWSRNIARDEPLINQPPISTNLKLEWKQGGFWIFNESSWSLRPSYTFKQFQAPRVIPIQDFVNGTANLSLESEIFDFIEAPDGYFLLDASWNYAIKNIEGSITAQNLLNTNYRNYLNELRYFSDEIGINIQFSVNYKF